LRENTKPPLKERVCNHVHAGEFTSANLHFAVAQLGWVLNQLEKHADDEELADLRRVESLALMDIKATLHPAVSAEFEKTMIDRGLVVPDYMPADLRG
jgi:hypothetical protein